MGDRNNAINRSSCPTCGAALAFTAGTWRCNPCATVVTNPVAASRSDDSNKDEKIANLTRQFTEMSIELSVKEQTSARLTLELDGLKLDYDHLLHENENLCKQVAEMNERFAELQSDSTETVLTHSPADEELKVLKAELRRISTADMTKANLLAAVGALGAESAGTSPEQPSSTEAGPSSASS